MRKKTKRVGAAVQTRRELVAEMLARRVPQAKIADALGFSRSTICKDVRALEAGWREAMLSNMTTLKARELFDLDVVEHEAWGSFERSKQNGKSGESRWLKVILDTKKRRAEMLGLDEPIEIRHGLAEKDLREMSDAELDQLEQQLAAGIVH